MMELIEIEELLNENLGRIEEIGKRSGPFIAFDEFATTCLNYINSTFQGNIAQLIDIEKGIESKLDQDVRLLYIQSLIYKLYLENINNMQGQDLPSDVKAYAEQDFSRILDYAVKGKKQMLTFNEYQLISYLQTICFKRFPVGNHNLSVSGIPRALLFKQSFKRAVKLVQLLVQMRGNHPLFELHYNPHRFRKFNKDGWQEVFHLSSKMLIKRPGIKGVFGATWFYDPVIKEISPELYYIREMIEEIGGEFFIVGSSDEDKKNAFTMSNVRKTAYDEGRYLPTSYMVIFPRSVLIRHFS